MFWAHLRAPKKSKKGEIRRPFFGSGFSDEASSSVSRRALTELQASAADGRFWRPPAYLVPR